MVEFETLEEKEVALARGCLRVAVEKAVSERGETEFLWIRKVAPKLQIFTAPSDIEKQQQAVEAEIKSLPPEALAQVLRFVRAAKEANRRL
ncbi:MAG: hypothetical protein M1503_09280 [Thaumarchaeota archaeon]|nr:hypothetical protein [Nitrososphaerota archaeon]MCL5318429.1 hypothetical protein [Nitrososphaerota archaeon]